MPNESWIQGYTDRCCTPAAVVRSAIKVIVLHYQKRYKEHFEFFAYAYYKNRSGTLEEHDLQKLKDLKESLGSSAYQEIIEALNNTFRDWTLEELDDYQRTFKSLTRKLNLAPIDFPVLSREAYNLVKDAGFGGRVNYTHDYFTASKTMIGPFSQIVFRPISGMSYNTSKREYYVCLVVPILVF